MEKFSFLAVLLLFSFCTCTLTQEVNEDPYDSYAPKYGGEGSSLNEDGFNPDATVELGGYQPVYDVDKGELDPSETKNYPEDSTDVENDKYPETADNPEISVDVKGDENPDLGGYKTVDDVDSGVLQPSESKDYSEVAADVEGDKYPEIADNSEVSLGVEGGENPDQGGYKPVDDVDSGVLLPSESKDYSEVSTNVEDGKYPEISDNPEVSVGAEGGENQDLGSYKPVDDVDSGVLLPSESKDYSEVSTNVEDGKYPETADNPEVSVGAEGGENPDLGGYESVNDVDSGVLLPSESKDYSEVSDDVGGDKYPETAVNPEVGAGSDENLDLAGYQPVDAADSGVLQPSESKEYSEVSTNVEDGKYPENAGNPEVSVGAEDDENPDLVGYKPVDDVDSGVLLPSESKDYSEVTDDVEGDNYPETAVNPDVGAGSDENPDLEEYQPVDVVDSGVLLPSESNDYSEVSTNEEDSKNPEIAENPEVGAGSNENPDLAGYQPVDVSDSGVLQPSESKDYSEVSTNVEDGKYPGIVDNPEVSVGAEGDENPDLGGYEPVDDVNNGVPLSSESKDYSEVSVDVEGDKYSETAGNPEVGAESDENPDLGEYQPVDVVDSGVLLPSESKDYSEVSADVEGDKYAETADNPEFGAGSDGNTDLAGYQPVDVVDKEDVEPSETKEYPVETVDLADNSVETNVSPETANEGDKYPEPDLQSENAVDTEKYESSDNYNNPAVSSEIEPYITTSYPEVSSDIEPYITTSYPEAISDVGANEPLEPTSYPEVVSDVDEAEPYVTTVNYPEGVDDVEENKPDESNGMAGGSDTSEDGMEIIPIGEEVPQGIPPNKVPCNVDDLNALAERLIVNVRPMIPDIVYLPDRRHGPFNIRSFFVRGVSRFAKNGQPAIACTSHRMTLNIPLYWDEPLIGYFQMSVAGLVTDVQITLPELEAETIFDIVHYTDRSTYLVYARDVRLTRSNAPVVVISNMGYFQRFANKSSSWLAQLFQARIRQFLSGQFQQILQEQVINFEVGFNYRGYY